MNKKNLRTAGAWLIIASIIIALFYLGALISYTLFFIGLLCILFSSSEQPLPFYAVPFIIIPVIASYIKIPLHFVPSGILQLGATLLAWIVELFFFSFVGLYVWRRKDRQEHSEVSQEE